MIQFQNIGLKKGKNMDKKTILAIVLSSLVLIVSLVVQTKVIMPRQMANAEKNQTTQTVEQEEVVNEEKEIVEADSNVVNEKSTESENVSEIEENEEFFEIKTNKALVKFTNRGGDIVSYQLTEHKDTDTGHGVEMVDNISSTNRAFSISIGESKNVLNEIFNVKKIDDYTIGFYKDVIIEGQKIQISKLYTFHPNDYVFTLDVGFDGGSSIVNKSYQLRSAPQIGPRYDRKKDRYEVREYVALNGNKKFRKTLSSKNYSKDYSWAGVAGKYFITLIKPEDMTKMSSKVETFSETSSEKGTSQIYLTRNDIGEKKAVDRYYIYNGPRNEKDLVVYNSSDKNSWGLVNAKFNNAIRTSGMLSWIEIALKWAMEQIYKLVKNWGISIIIVTLLIKILLFPLNKKSATGTLKMQQLQPQLKEIQDKYANDKQKLNEEMSKLYQKAGYNPASGCLPMIIQMIILFAMFNVFNNYFEFRGASFVKGWIDDLSRGDSILSWNKDIKVITGLTQNNLRILPFVYLISQLLNGIITQYGGSTAGQSKGQMFFMMYGMPILFFFMFYNVPSGLLLYWTTSNILQMGQQFIINAITKKKRKEMESNQKNVNVNEAKFKGGKKKSR